MPAPIRIDLTLEEEETLKALRVASTVPQRTRDRAHMIRLNAQGWNVPELAEIFDCCEHTVRSTLKRWQSFGLGGLWDAPGRGRPRSWQEADLAYLEQLLEQDSRTYNSRQLSHKLASERQVNLSADRIRRLLKKNAGDGNGLV